MLDLIQKYFGHDQLGLLRPESGRYSRTDRVGRAPQDYTEISVWGFLNPINNPDLIQKYFLGHGQL